MVRYDYLFTQRMSIVYSKNNTAQWNQKHYGHYTYYNNMILWVLLFLVEQVKEIQLSEWIQLSKIVLQQITNNITFTRNRFNGAAKVGSFKALLFHKIGIINTTCCFIVIFRCLASPFSYNLIFPLLNTQLYSSVQRTCLPSSICIIKISLNIK